MSRKSKLLKTLLLTSLSVTLTACWKTTGSAGTDQVSAAAIPLGRYVVQDSFCSWAEPIYWSKNDTPETIAQIKLKHNVPYVTKCPK